MKPYKILPSVNNIDFAGRLSSDPRLNNSGTVITFNVIRNFGGDKSPVLLTFVMFKPKNGEFPKFLKKGAPVIVHAYFNPNVWTDSHNETREEIQYVVKTVEKAELVEVSKKDAAAAEGADGGNEEVDID